MVERINLSTNGRIKKFVRGLDFFEKSAEKIIHLCNDLVSSKRKNKSFFKKKVGANSLEVISKKLSPDLFDSEEEGESSLYELGSSTLKNFKSIYKPLKRYSEKSEKYLGKCDFNCLDEGFERNFYVGIFEREEERYSFDEEEEVFEEISVLKF